MWLLLDRFKVPIPVAKEIFICQIEVHQAVFGRAREMV